VIKIPEIKCHDGEGQELKFYFSNPICKQITKILSFEEGVGQKIKSAKALAKLWFLVWYFCLESRQYCL
jgi:hypothetical protein